MNMNIMKIDAVFFFTFQLFPPTVCGTVIKRRRKVYIV